MMILKKKKKKNTAYFPKKKKKKKNSTKGLINGHVIEHCHYNAMPSCMWLYLEKKEEG